MALGQAGGTAAALALREGLGDAREVDVKRLQQMLKEQGARL
ncbi:hypothetical protein RZO55_14640 [Clostridium boliviensis]|uniref:FAD-dependent oxidoreductase n=1 Tax=Clostridium boliviensis TaxID=318465 RepID=A0ABU4GMG5_9CLOT|nr:hypothetical protein [Clostridium boliviensis]MDW2798813.1 hypothetical protein [Clostridium boliviensis]